MQVFIILSCLIAVSVNFSTFLVIGKTSPVTYQVLGHLKTCLVLGFGYTLLHDPFTYRNIIGILVAIFGMGLYSYFCLQENKKKQAGDLSLGSQIKDKDGIPLLSIDKDGHEVKKSTKNSLVWLIGNFWSWFHLSCVHYTLNFQSSRHFDGCKCFSFFFRGGGEKDSNLLVGVRVKCSTTRVRNPTKCFLFFELINMPFSNSIMKPLFFLLFFFFFLKIKNI